MRIEKLTPDQWKVLSEKAHLIVFGENKSPEFDRIDYALLAIDEGNVQGFITVRETDFETVYWQFGGAFPGTRGSLATFQCYAMAVNWTKERYKRITTYIENTNVTMLKFAMKIGFRVNGIKTTSDAILLHLEFLC